MKNLIIASIFLIPLASIIPINGTVVWYPQLLALFAIGLSLLALKFWNTNKFISLLLIYEVFSYLFITQQSPRTMICLIAGFCGVFMALAVSKLKHTRIIFKCLVGMAIFQSIYVIFQYFNLDPFFHGEDGRADVVGFVGSHNQLGIYYSGLSPIFASINSFLAIFSCIPIFLAKQNTAIISMIAGLTCYGCFMWNKKVLAVLFLVILLLAIPWVNSCGKTKGVLMERINLWKSTIQQSISGKAVQKNGNIHKVFICNPLFGFGLGNFFTISPFTQLGFLPKDTGHVYEHAHNDLVEAFFELGYIGIILILLCIASVIADFITCLHLAHPNSKSLIIYFSSLVSLSVSSMCVYVFHAPVSLFMFFLILGLFYKEVKDANKSQIFTLA